MSEENLKEEFDYFKDDEECVTFDELNCLNEEYINHEDNVFNDSQRDDLIDFCLEESENHSDDFNESGINKLSISYDSSKYNKENLERYYVYLNRFLKDNGFTVTFGMSFWYGNFDFRISEKRVMLEGKKKKSIRLDFITIKDFFEKNGLNVEAVSKNKTRFRRNIFSTENEYFVSVRLNSPFFEKHDSEILYEEKTLYDVTVETKVGTYKFSNAEVNSYAEIVEITVYDKDNKISEIFEFSKNQIKYVKKTVNDEKKENGKWIL